MGATASKFMRETIEIAKFNNNCNREDWKSSLKNSGKLTLVRNEQAAPTNQNMPCQDYINNRCIRLATDTWCNIVLHHSTSRPPWSNQELLGNHQCTLPDEECQEWSNKRQLRANGKHRHRLYADRTLTRAGPLQNGLLTWLHFLLVLWL